jgi:hypothetical protein
MSLANAVFSGPPTSAVTPSPRQANIGLDQTNGVLYFTGQGATGWAPLSSSVAKVGLTAQVANNANVLTYAVTKTGVFEAILYEVSTNTPTAATLPAITVTYTDADSNTSVTQTLASVGSVAAAGVVNQGQFVIRPLAGTNVVIATTSYAAGSGTALAYAVHARVVAD